ncbi:uncharacterized protein V1513DRAFT_427867 [Lipomyces chichibuensis]|uniref:uncharacterized protein n=1 Tax=Lipomyces chichibuensis TaxID=1546026 RepID=UPI0033442257
MTQLDQAIPYYETMFRGYELLATEHFKGSVNSRLGDKTIEACMCLKGWDWSSEPKDADEVEESDGEDAAAMMLNC